MQVPPFSLSQQLADLGRRWGVSPAEAEKVLYALVHDEGDDHYCCLLQLLL